jgi:uncharacterized membrane protein YjgN (DUF898 family)
VICPNCAGPLSGAPALCPRCGHPILEEDRTFRFSFEGDTVEFFGWCVLLLVSALAVVPLARTVAAIGRWFCRNLKLRDNTTVGFSGTGLEILGWLVLSVLVSAPPSVIHRAHPPLVLAVVLGIATLVLGLWISLLRLRWAVRKIELSSGQELNFDGSYAGYVGYHVLLGLSGITIIGWAWVKASYYGWLAEHTRGKDVALRCQVEGWDVLWRTVMAVVCSIPIVTIPWAWMWYHRWLVSTVTLTRGVSMADFEWA